MGDRASIENQPAPLAAPSLQHTTLVLIILSLVAFLNTMSNGFVWDDHGFIDGPWLESHRSRPLSTFTRGSMEGSSLWQTAGYYRPLVTLTKVADFILWERWPPGYHLTNLAMHVVCVILAYGILRRTLGVGWIPFFASAIFAVHPVHAESVSFFAGRTDVLYTLFLLISVHLFLDHRSGRLRSVAWPASLVAFAAALLSKETAACLPMMLAILLVTDPRGGRRRWLALIPYLVLLVIYLTIRLIVLPQAGIVTSYPPAFGDFSSTLATMPGVLLIYCRVSLIPAALAVYREIGLIPSIADPRAISGLVAVLALFASGVLVRRHRVLLLAWAWFLLPLLPVSNLIPSGAIQADRYLYLPVLGSSILIAWAIEQVMQRRAWVGLALAGAVTISLLSMTIHRNRDWRDDASLWRANVADYPRSVDARLNLGAALGKEQNPFGAIEHLEEAHRLAPHHPLVSYNLGFAREEAARIVTEPGEMRSLLEDAEGSYRASVASGGPPSAHERLGRLLDRKGLKEEAAESMRRALPHSVAAFLYLADAARESGDRDGEIRLLESLVESHAAHWEAVFRLGELYQATGAMGKARALYHRLWKESVDPGIRNLAGQALSRLDRP
ncbi:MAG: glycosyltransferase family 39 protein [Planctomycetota bacterium]|nr:glycosyltransferase family 39 protein [Planctomycetota bacterium]